ncbi:MAG: hypothetical protein M0R80_25660 [Proteobacteria bacterium]|jgi:hypothetical protein|nr:hypothetical protein [Pseudomonadota bacterium]
MNMQDLKHGQYFQHADVVGRVVDKHAVYFNAPNTFDLKEAWCNIDVTPVDFQTVILLLINHCIKSEQDTVPQQNTDAVSPSTLKPKQFFVDKRGAVGFVYNDKACYLSDSNSFIYDQTKNIPICVPVTMQQAALAIAQKFLA